jgi:hypothetical protein
MESNRQLNNQISRIKARDVTYRFGDLLHSINGLFFCSDTLTEERW